MPVEAGKGSMLCAFVLHEKRTLLGSELLQVPEMENKEKEIDDKKGILNPVT